MFSKYKEKLKGNIFFQNIAVVAGGNFTAKLIAILATPVITRLYTPEDYGLYSVFISIIGIVGSFATMRYSVTIPIARDERLADNLLKLCFVITITLSLLWFVGLAVFGNVIAVKLSSEQLLPYLWLLPIVFFTKGIYEALNSWAIRVKNFKLITHTIVSQSISSTSIKIGLGLLGVAPLGLFIGHVAQEAAGIGSLLSKLIKTKQSFFKELKWGELKFAANRYKRFPLVQSWSQLLLALGAQLPVLLLGVFYGVEVVGVFGLALGMINLPMGLIGQSVSQVFFAEISKYGNNETDKIYSLSISIVKKMFIISLLPVAILLLLGPWLFETVFGDEWYKAGIYARYFSLLVLVQFTSSPLVSVFNVFEKQGLQLMLNIIRVVLVALIFYISHLLNVNADRAVLLYSIVLTIYGVFSMFVIFKLIRSYK